MKRIWFKRSKYIVGWEIFVKKTDLPLQKDKPNVICSNYLILIIEMNSQWFRLLRRTTWLKIIEMNYLIPDYWNELVDSNYWDELLDSEYWDELLTFHYSDQLSKYFWSIYCSLIVPSTNNSLSHHLMIWMAKGLLGYSKCGIRFAVYSVPRKWISNILSGNLSKCTPPSTI